MRDLGSAADQRWAVPETYGDTSAAADPGSAVTNGLSGKVLAGSRHALGFVVA
jgi:hypothetical protein